MPIASKLFLATTCLVAILTILFFLIGEGIVSASQPKVILGVLEKIPAHYVGQSSSYGVRVLFQKKDDGWTSFPSSCPNQACLKNIASAYPSVMKWHMLGFHKEVRFPIQFHWKEIRPFLRNKR